MEMFECSESTLEELEKYEKELVERMQISIFVVRCRIESYRLGLSFLGQLFGWV